MCSVLRCGSVRFQLQLQLLLLLLSVGLLPACAHFQIIYHNFVALRVPHLASPFPRLLANTLIKTLNRSLIYVGIGIRVLYL